ncbi:MAG: hypothetical protein HWN67_18230 [Candidatus Helarchaeota archaeon]|nr:hypothetical protein [Candidatus Helarchaeota archaeon]
MSQWLGLPKIKKEDIEKWQPTFVENFPVLAKYFVDDQKLRVTIVMEYDMADKFIAKIKKKYKKAVPSTIHKAALEAIEDWLKK